MQQVGRTSTGNVIVEMSTWEWEQIQLRPLKSEKTDTLLWQIRHARHQGKLDDPLTRLLSRACTPGGRLADVTFADFLAMIESGEITQVPQVGPARARTLYKVFVAEEGMQG